jgi:hypothetical protein
MVDTPVLGLPVGIAVVLTWARRRRGQPLPRGIEAGIGLLAGLVAWQCVFAVGVVVAATVASRRRAGLRDAAPLALGAGVGVVLTIAWIGLAYGDFDTLRVAFFTRSATDGASGIADAVDAQLLWLPDLLGPAGLGVLGAVLALTDARRRAPAVVLLGCTFGWAVAMAEGATVHSYWLYWTVVPTAFGAAWLVERALALELPVPAVRHAAAGALGLLLVAGVVTSSYVQHSEASGAAAGELVTSADLPAGQDALYLLGVVNPPPTWIGYQVGRPPVWLDTPDDVRRVADEHPDDLVLVSTWCPADRRPNPCADVVAPQPMWQRDYLLLPAAEVARRLAA